MAVLAVVLTLVALSRKSPTAPAAHSAPKRPAHTVVKIDPVSGKAVRTIPIGHPIPSTAVAPGSAGSLFPRGIAVGEGSVWVTNGDRSHQGAPLDAHAGATVVREQMRRLDQACAAAGRDPASLDRLVLTGPHLDAGLTSRAAFEDVTGAYADIGVTDLVVHWPRPAGPYAGDPAVLERIMG